MIAIRNVLASLKITLLYPRVLLSAWFAVTVPALIAVWPAFRTADANLTTHPGASFLRGQALDVDLARENPDIGVWLVGGAVFTLLAGVFLSGGILACVGRQHIEPVKFTCARFFGMCARLFPRNLRVLVIAVVPAAALFWGADALDGWLREGVLYSKDPGAIVVPVIDIRWAQLLEILAYFWGFVFLVLLFVSKVAMAHLALHDKHSALAAWLVATGKVLRHPLQTCLTVTLFAVIWVVGAHLLGTATVQFLEVGQDLWLGLLFGQLGIALGLVVWIGFVLGARGFLEQAAAKPQSRVAPMADLSRKTRTKPEKAAASA